MKIEKLVIKNIKGLNASVSFDTVNLVYGKNASGKTAILDSIRLSCLGYHPDLGKTSKSIKLLSSGSNISATCIFDNKEISTFSIEDNGSGSFTKKHYPAPNIEDLIIQLDPDLYYSATAQEKRNLIFCTNPSYEKDSIRSKIINTITNIRDEPSSLELEVIISINEFINKAFKNNVNLTEAIKEIVDFIKENIQKTQNAKKHTKNVIYDFALNDEDEAKDYPIEYLKNEYQRLKAQLKELEETEILQNRIAQVISEHKIEINRLDELQTQKPNFDKIKTLQVDLDKAVVAYDDQLNSLNDKLNLIIGEQADNLAILDDCKNVSFESAINKLPLGQYIIKVEVNKDKEDVGTVVWECNKFKELEDDKLSLLYEEIEAVKTEKNKSILDLKNQIHDLEEEKNTYDTKQTKEYLTKKISDLKAEFIGAKQLSVISSSIESINEQIDQYCSKIQAFEAHRKKIQDIEKNQSELKDWEIESRLLLDCKKTLDNILKETQGEIFSSLLNSLNKFTDAMGIINYTIVDSEIGYLINDRFVSYKTFSGSEKCILDCALTIALAIEGKCKIAIIDELGRFDEERKRNMYLAVNSLINDGLLDQAIFVDVNIPISVENINIIDVCML
jgi:DNA repair exonuclease SbcCD ATPase subunit